MAPGCFVTFESAVFTGPEEINNDIPLPPSPPPRPSSPIQSSTSPSSNYQTLYAVDSFEVLEQTIIKQKRLAKMKNNDMRLKVLLKRTFNLVCEIMDHENGFDDDAEPYASAASTSTTTSTVTTTDTTSTTNSTDSILDSTPATPVQNNYDDSENNQEVDHCLELDLYDSDQLLPTKNLINDLSLGFYDEKPEDIAEQLSNLNETTTIIDIHNSYMSARVPTLTSQTHPSFATKPTKKRKRLPSEDSRFKRRRRSNDDEDDDNNSSDDSSDEDDFECEQDNENDQDQKLTRAKSISSSSSASSSTGSEPAHASSSKSSYLFHNLTNSSKLVKRTFSSSSPTSRHQPESESSRSGKHVKHFSSSSFNIVS